MEKKENIIIRWLKRISFTQFLAITLSIIGVIIAYKTLVVTEKSLDENKSSELSIELYNPETEESVDIKDATSIFVLFLREEKRHIDILSYDGIHPIYIPHLSNKSSKSLQNFHCEICVNTTSQLESEYKSNDYDDDEEVYEIEKDINSKFSFVIDEDDEYDFRLVYKENILRAHESLPIPINEIWIPEDEGFLSYDMDYKITYDGLDEPLILNVFIEAYNGKINKGFLKVHLTHLHDRIQYDDDFEYSKTISMIYSDEKHLQL